MQWVFCTSPRCQKKTTVSQKKGAQPFFFGGGGIVVYRGFSTVSFLLPRLRRKGVASAAYLIALLGPEIKNRRALISGGFLWWRPASRFNKERADMSTAVSDRTRIRKPADRLYRVFYIAYLALLVYQLWKCRPLTRPSTYFGWFILVPLVWLRSFDRIFSTSCLTEFGEEFDTKFLFCSILSFLLKLRGIILVWSRLWFVFFQLCIHIPKKVVNFSNTIFPYISKARKLNFTIHENGILCSGTLTFPFMRLVFLKFKFEFFLSVEHWEVKEKERIAMNRKGTDTSTAVNERVCAMVKGNRRGSNTAQRHIKDGWSPTDWPTAPRSTNRRAERISVASSFGSAPAIKRDERL